MPGVMGHDYPTKEHGKNSAPVKQLENKETQ